MGKPGKINSQSWRPKPICGCGFFQIEAEDDEIIVSGHVVKNVRPFAVREACDEHSFPFDVGTHGRAIDGTWQDPYAYIGWLWNVGIYRVLRERRDEFRVAEDTLSGPPLALRLFHLEDATKQYRDTMLKDLPEKMLWWPALNATVLKQTLNDAVQGMVAARSVEWPYTVPASPPQPPVKGAPVAGYEVAATGLHDTVHNEDGRRSAVIQIIGVTMGLTGPDDEATSAAVLKIATFEFQSADRLPGTDERVLEVTISGTNKQQRDGVKDAADVMFGSGAVVVL